MDEGQFENGVLNTRFGNPGEVQYKLQSHEGYVRKKCVNGVIYVPYDKSICDIN